MFEFTAPAKRSIQKVTFLISTPIDMLWVLIRSALLRQGTSNEYPQHLFLWRNKKKTSVLSLIEKKSVLSEHM